MSVVLQPVAHDLADFTARLNEITARTIKANPRRSLEDLTSETTKLLGAIIVVPPMLEYVL